MGKYVGCIQQIQGSLSMLQYDSRSDWYLMVEGTTDRDFYVDFVNNPKLKIASMDAALYDINGICLYGKKVDSSYNRNFKVIPGKKSQKKQIVCFINSKINTHKNYFGIIDADYDYDYSISSEKFLNEIIRNTGRYDINESLDKHIKITDAHSLESLMIKYSYQEIAKLQTYKIIVDLALEYSYKIGLIRQWHSKQWDNSEKGDRKKELYLDFDTVKKNTDQYKDLIDSNTTFSEYSYISRISKTVNDENQIFNRLKRTYSNGIKENPFQLGSSQSYEICQGHDIIDFLCSIYCKKYGKKFSYDEVYENFKKWFLNNLNCKTAFSNSPLGQWLANI